MAWAKAREAALAEPGALDAAQHRGVLVGDVLGWFLEHSDYASGRSKLASVRFLQTQAIAEFDALTLTVEQVVAYARERRAGGAAPATVNGDIIWLRQAFKKYHLAKAAPVAVGAVDDAAQLLREARVIGPSARRDRRPSVAELNALLDYSQGRDGRASLPMVELILFALFSARRQDEMCRLLWADVDHRRRAVLVRDMKHPRGVRDTWVFLTDEALAIIDRQPRDGPRIFPYKGKSVSAAFTRSCRFLALEDLRFHDLRHECASWLFELGWDIPRVAGVTGHQSWGSLQRYTHLQGLGVYDKYAGWGWRPAV
ncbi:MAG: tyrosine-type recombinase/integrase [Candidatus Reddybacter sp.]